MELGLMHPEHGYYSTKERIFNKGGDFTTSPEISQMFGEMLGLWIMSAIRNNYTPEAERDSSKLPPLGRLNTVNLVELGPGSGLMMSDILRVISSLLSNRNAIFRL
jgi:SAM-dependent MidA family methyltransferase